MLRLRTAQRDDHQLLRALLFEAAHWRSDVGRPPLDEALANPELAAAVLPGHRGRGIGKALLGALQREARHRGIDRLSLSVERDNPAIALYERLGFRTLDCERTTLTMVCAPGRPYRDGASGRER